jgi:hypothetical protein
MTEVDTFGELFLIVSLSGYPSGDNFDYYDIVNSDFHEVHMVWPAEERVSRTYFIAVVVSSASVSTQSLGYSITGTLPFYSLSFMTHSLTAYGTPF